MAAVPHYHGCFTLLYGDPEVREQQQYLQPLYGLTAADDPPTRRHPRESSQDGSLSSTTSSLTSADDINTDEGPTNMPRVSIPGEPAVRRHKHPRISSGFSPAHPLSPEGSQREEATSSPHVSGSTGAGNSTTGTTPSSPAATARPPRVVNRNELSLYPELCTGVVGPQPVFGGVALSHPDEAPSPLSSAGGAATEAQTTAASTTEAPYLFNTSGAPLLSSVIDAEALRRLQEARRPYQAPSPRSGHVLLSCPSRGTLILFGGLGDDPFNDVWEYSTVTGRWTRLECRAASEDKDHRGDGGDSHSHRHHRRRRRSSATPRELPAASTTTATEAEAETNADLTGPGENESIAAFIARLRAQSGAPAQPSTEAASSDTESESEDGDGHHRNDDDDDYFEDVLDVADDEAGEENSSEVHAFRSNEDLPPPAYGQAASLFYDENGDECMAVLGGITVGDVCVHGFFALNLAKLTWRRLETTMLLKDMWGATAQTLHAPRRYARDPAAATTTTMAREDINNEEEEQVVVLFGGMTAMGEVIDPTTHVLHLDHTLTKAEVAANVDLFLDSIDYTQREEDRVMRHVMREEDAAAQAADNAPMDDNQNTSIEERCARWRVRHADRIARWRRRAIDSLEGKYWIEVIPATPGLHGRRRPTSAAYNRHFMYIFGGRDDLYFYNDLWCLNIVTRTWVQVRDGIPAALMRNFLAQPHNPMYGTALNEKGAQLRRRTVAAVDTKLAQSTMQVNISGMIRSRETHHALYSSSVNSTARARTGACMVVDVRRECLYLYGGFSYTGQQHLTFFDLHAYYIRENVWRRVGICHNRPWSVALDAAQDAVRLVDACEEARPYPRHAGMTRPVDRANSAPTSALPLSLMGYAMRYMHPREAAEGERPSASLCCPPDLPPALPIVRRGARGGNAYCDSAKVTDRNLEKRRGVNPSTHFHLPSFIPEARTMAAMAEDPISPGTRFFLHGGRSGEEACGDFFELRTSVSRTVDVEYAKTQRAARLEAQTTAAAAASASRRSSSPASTSGRPSTSATPGTVTANASPVSLPAPTALTPASAAPSLSSTTAFTPAASTAAAAANSANAASTSQADANRLQLRNRRQLQRQLVSAALEVRELFEDAPAAHAATVADTAPLPRRSLRDLATQWVRDGIAAADPKSLMFVELRNGHAVVNLRTHIHYSSRLSLLASSEQRSEDTPLASSGIRVGGGADGSEQTAPAGADRVPRRNIHYPSRPYVRATAAKAPPPASASASAAAAAFTTQQQMDSLDGHLKRSALSLEVLLYDVLLSKPVCNNNNGGAGGHNGEGVMTSPCTHSAVLSTSPENHPTFPACPLPQGGSPSTSPGAGTPLPASPHVQIVSRAQYSTPRTPQPLPGVTGLPSSAPQQQQETMVDWRQQEHRAPSPALTRRSSSFCSTTGASGNGVTNSAVTNNNNSSSVGASNVSAGASSYAGGAAYPPPSPNNEYDYHILLRALFHHEPFYKTFGASEKKR